MKSKFSQNLKLFRTQMKLSQRALAKEIGVSQKAIDHWELDEAEPKASSIIKLSRFFGVTCDYLLGEEK